MELTNIRQIHHCPTCKTELQTLLFLGIEPDGYVCPTCKVLFHPETLKPLAHVIGISDLAHGHDPGECMTGGACPICEARDKEGD